LFCCILGCLLFFRFVLSLSVFSCTVLFVSISQVIGCEVRLRNDLCCVEWSVKLYSNQPTNPVSNVQGPATPSTVDVNRRLTQCPSISAQSARSRRRHGSPSNTHFLGLAKSICQTASQSIHPFCRTRGCDQQTQNSYHIISYQGFLVRPLLREPRPQVHYKSQPDAKAQREVLYTVQTRHAACG